MNILRALEDEQVFAPFFRGETWGAWRVFLAALFALPLTAEQLATYQRHTGRSTPPAQPSHEAWLVCGRRSGKSFVLAAVAVFLAAFRDWRPFLGPGERGTIMVIAADRRQARVIMRYVTGPAAIGAHAGAVDRERDAGAYWPAQSRHIEVHTASFRINARLRIVAGLLDELAFWPTDEDSAEPDVRGDQRPASGHGDDTGRHVAVCVFALCAQGRVVRRAPQALWQGRRPGLGVACPDARR